MSRRRLSDTRPSEALEIARELWRRGLASVRRTPGLLLVSLLIGGVLWVFVTDTEDPTRVDLFPASISVQAVNTGRTLAVANTLPAVQVRVSASEARWERLTSDNFRAFVDLNGLAAREQQVRVHVDVEDIGGVRVVETIPPTVLVNLEDFVSKQVPAVARLVGTVPLGYEVGDASPEQGSVAVSGPESLVELVRRAVADVNVTGLTVPLSQAVALTPRGDSGGEILGVRLDPPSVRVDVDVLQSTLERALPISVAVTGEPAAGYRVTAVVVSPATLMVQGTFQALQGVQSLTLPDVDITGATDTVSRTVQLSLEPGLEAPGRLSPRVTVKIVPIEGSLRLSLAPEAVGVGQGLVATLPEQSVTVILAGPMPALNAIGLADVRAVVNLDGRQAGTVDLPVDVQAPPGLSLVTVQPRTLSVTLEASR